MTPSLAQDPVYQRIRRAFVSEIHRIDAGFDPARAWRDLRRDGAGRKPHAARRHSERWSLGEDETLARLVAEGASQLRIAQKLGRTTGSVNSRVSLLRRKGLL